MSFSHYFKLTFVGFGAPAPAPGGLFSSPAPAPGGLFGTSTFGTPAPAGSSLFGGTPSSGGAFGGTSTFGQPQQQQPAQPQVPAQAALQAHMDASNRQEAEKIKAALEKLHSGYAGTATNNNKFVSVVYNDLTQDQRQLQWLHGMGSGTTLPVAPPRPPQVSEEDWTLAVVRNPDPQSYMPIALVGADALNARVTWQQERATQLSKDAESIRASHETVQQLWTQGHRRLEQIQRAHTNHRKQLLQVMRKIELVRCMNQPLQADEVRVVERLNALEQQIRQVQHLLGELQGPLHKAAAQRPEPPREIHLPDKAQLSKVLKGHREDITNITKTVRKDIRDLNLLKGRLAPREGAVTASTMAATPHLQLR